MTFVFSALVVIPSKIYPLVKRILSSPLTGTELNKSFFLDFFINLIGFIPLGFLVAAVLFQFGRPENQAIFLSVVLCFGLSLAIEVLQA